MVPKGLLGGVIGFILGGLVVSTAYTIDKEELAKTDQPAISTVEHNQQNTVRLAALSGDDFDKAFIEEMIAHHQGAIDMAELADDKAKHEEIKSLSRDILRAQSTEIDMMQTWQSDWGYKNIHKSQNSH